MMMVWCGYINK